MGRHFVQTGKKAGLGSTVMKAAIREILDKAKTAPDYALKNMPEDFSHDIHESIAAAIANRLFRLESALEDLSD